MSSVERKDELTRPPDSKIYSVLILCDNRSNGNLSSPDVRLGKMKITYFLKE